MYSNDLICDILIYINENIYSKISIDDLEKRFFYNRFYIMKLFKKEINLTIVDYINKIRIYNSLKLMKNNNYSLLKISLKSGFYSLEYFSETFKKIMGFKPLVVKKYLQNNSNISDTNMFKVRISINKLYETNNIMTNYLSKRKPKNRPVKSLSKFSNIF